MSLLHVCNKERCLLQPTNQHILNALNNLTLLPKHQSFAQNVLYFEDNHQSNEKFH